MMTAMTTNSTTSVISGLGDCFLLREEGACGFLDAVCRLGVLRVSAELCECFLLSVFEDIEA